MNMQLCCQNTLAFFAGRSQCSDAQTEEKGGAIVKSANEMRQEMQLVVHTAVDECIAKARDTVEDPDT